MTDETETIDPRPDIDGESRVQRAIRERQEAEAAAAERTEREQPDETEKEEKPKKARNAARERLAERRKGGTSLNASRGNGELLGEIRSLHERLDRMEKGGGGSASPKAKPFIFGKKVGDFESTADFLKAREEAKAQHLADEEERIAQETADAAKRGRTQDAPAGAPGASDTELERNLAMLERRFGDDEDGFDAVMDSTNIAREMLPAILRWGRNAAAVATHIAGSTRTGNRLKRLIKNGDWEDLEDEIEAISIDIDNGVIGPDAKTRKVKRVDEGDIPDNTPDIRPGRTKGKKPSFHERFAAHSQSKPGVFEFTVSDS